MMITTLLAVSIGWIALCLIVLWITNPVVLYVYRDRDDARLPVRFRDWARNAPTPRNPLKWERYVARRANEFGRYPIGAHIPPDA